MYIAPDTTVRVLKNVPLDNTYRDTIYFTSVASQTSYFSGLTKYTVNDYTYQRKERVLCIGIKADNLYDCNYIMFQNTAFGSKWFYAFIVNVEYVSNETSYITFEIDVMQTWFFNYTLKRSYIEREHSATDEIGDNLVPENVELGDYRYFDLGITGLFNDYRIVMACTFDKNLNNAVGGLYGGVYSGLAYNTFDTAAEANAFITKATDANKSDGIICIYMLPLVFAVGSNSTTPAEYTITRDKKTNSLDGYVPKNKKLFTYPYNMLYVTDNEGACANYHFEYFSTANCTFTVSGVMCCTPEVILVPTAYKGVQHNYNEQMTISNFPQCAYSIDSFKAFIAQNANRLMTNMAMGTIQTAAGGTAMAATGGIIGGSQAASGLTSIANDLATIGDKSTLPPQGKGVQSSYINMAIKRKGFNFYYVCIRAEFARIIDDFFSVYGYASHKLKTPNRAVRQNWCYSKTRNCCAVGSVPVDDMEKIKSVYNNGVTFWKNGANVGNYELPNDPV